MKSAYLTFGATAAAVLGAALYLGVGAADVNARQTAEDAAQGAPVLMAQADDAQADNAQTEAAPTNANADIEEALKAKGYAIGDIPMGEADAPVTMIEYISLTCPHCANFHNNTLPALKEKYVDSGKLRVITREVYFDQFGLWATAVARCGGPKRYHAYLDVFFKRQREWTRGENQQAIVAEIQRLGRLGGLSQTQVDECLSDQDLVTHLVETYQAHAEADGVSSTPYFLINGEEVRGARSVEDMSVVIDAHLND